MLELLELLVLLVLLVLLATLSCLSQLYVPNRRVGANLGDSVLDALAMDRLETLVFGAILLCEESQR